MVHFPIKLFLKFLHKLEEILQYIRNTIKKHKILADDLLKRMGLSREQGPLTDLEVRLGLKRLMPDLSEISISKVIKYLSSKGPLTPLKMLEGFEFEEETETYDQDWLNLMFRKLAQKDWKSLASELEVFSKETTIYS